jgi:hypothetical protein
MKKGMGGESVSRFKHAFIGVRKCKNISLITFPNEFSL